MTTTSKKNRPSHRVSFARIIGSDETGDKLGSAREIGSVWPRANGRGSIIRLDFIPVELTRNQGVLFLNPVQDAGKAGGQ